MLHCIFIIIDGFTWIPTTYSPVSDTWHQIGCQLQAFLVFIICHLLALLNPQSHTLYSLLCLLPSHFLNFQITHHQLRKLKSLDSSEIRDHFASYLPKAVQACFLNHLLLCLSSLSHFSLFPGEHSHSRFVASTPSTPFLGQLSAHLAFIISPGLSLVQQVG